MEPEQPFGAMGNLEFKKSSVRYFLTSVSRVQGTVFDLSRPQNLFTEDKFVFYRN